MTEFQIVRTADDKYVVTPISWFDEEHVVFDTRDDALWHVMLHGTLAYERASQFTYFALTSTA